MQALRLLLVFCLAGALGAADPAPFELKPTIEGLLAPDDLEISLVAKDPLVNNIAAMCVAPDGRIFVCEDYVHARVPGLNKDVVKVLIGAENGGAVTQALTVAEDLNSVQGLAYHDGYVYINHSPKLSRVRISTDNKAGPLEDVFDGIGYGRPVKPAHGGSGLFVHENKLYIVFGDQGCDFTDKEGRRMALDTGAILRCDPDGSNLEIFAHGFRNIYGVAMDPMGNVFVRDNTNDGGGYNVRNYHVVKGAYYGWPFRWREGDSATPPVDVLTKSRDLGGGSPCGQMWLRSAKWPAKYNNAVWACEWGRAHIAFIRPVQQGATFDLPELKLIADAREKGARYEFRPTVAALAPDQSVLIADWAAGPLYPTEKKGRLFRVKPRGAIPTPPPAPGVDDLVAAMGPQTPADVLIRNLDENGAVRARAAYLLGERRHAEAGPKLATLLNDADPVVRLRVAIALGDMKDAKYLSALTQALGTEKERWVRQLLIRGVRQSGSAAEIAAAIQAAPQPLQKDLLFAFRDNYDESVVNELLEFAKSGAAPEVRGTAIEFLGLVARKESKRWAWGDKPNLQPSVRDQDWAATEKIVSYLRDAVRSADAATRSAALLTLQKINDTTVIDTVLADLKSGALKLNDESAAILTKLSGNQKAVDVLAEYAQRNGNSVAVRTEVAQLFGLWKDEASLLALRGVAFTAESASLRAAAIDGLARRKDLGSIKNLVEMLRGQDAELQRAAARALGLLGADAAVEDLVKAAGSTDRPLKSQALAALWRIERNGASEAFLRGLFALPVSEDAIQTEILEAIGGSPRNKLEPALLAWLEFGAPGKGTEKEIIERLDKSSKNTFGLVAGNREKRAAAIPKIAAYRAKTWPKFQVPAMAAAPVAQPAEDEDARLERLTKTVMNAKGDAAKGAAVFRDVRGANCIGCHIVGGEGRRIGPELSEVASKYTREQLAESVLYPSKQLLDGYEQSLLTLKSGERLLGIVMNEDAEKLSVAKSDGSTVTIPVADVAKRTKSKNSLMPDGLVNPISDTDFFDLIAYLETLRKPGQ